MAIRPLDLRQHATIHRFTAASAVSAGRAVLLSGSDNDVAHAGAGSDLAIGTALNDAATGQPVDVALYGPVIPVKVASTGAATRGTKVVLLADGYSNAPAHDSSGATDDPIYGIFAQSGAANDLVGMIQAPSNRGSA